MTVHFTDGTTATFRKEEAVLVPLVSQCDFNPDIEEHWESDRAWVVCYPGNTIFHEGRFRTVDSVK